MRKIILLGIFTLFMAGCTDSINSCYEQGYTKVIINKDHNDPALYCTDGTTNPQGDYYNTPHGTKYRKSYLLMDLPRDAQ
jgi:hypothetical protein